VHLGGSLEADEQPPELVKPRQAALDRPALRAEARAVLGLAAGDHGRDAQTAKLPAVRVAVVAAIPQEPRRSSSGPTACPGDRRNGV